MDQQPTGPPPTNSMGYSGSQQPQHFHLQDTSTSGDHRQPYAQPRQNQNDHRHPQHHPSTQDQLARQHQAAQEAEMSMKQRIAQKMLTSQAPSSEPYHSQRGIFDVPPPQNQSPEPQLIPPWETAPGIVTGEQSGLLPALQLHQDIHHPSSLNMNANLLAALNMDQGSAYSGSGASGGANSTPSQPRSVTFGTHDQIHQWDEQLDILKYVDEEFFNVAHFLLEVVGTNTSSLEEYNLNMASLDEAQELMLNRGGGLLSRLFGCGGGVTHLGSSLSSGDGDGAKKDPSKNYRLTQKLANDFYTAVKYRMEHIDEKAVGDNNIGGVGGGDSVAARTKEIARKINAYGLPLLPMSAKIEVKGDDMNEGTASDGKEENEDEKDNDNDEEFLDTFGSKPHHHQFFPVLPLEDEDNDGHNDENDHGLSNRRLHQGIISPKFTAKEASSTKPAAAAAAAAAVAVATSIQPMPTPKKSFFSTLLKRKSSTPTDEECRLRLGQIRHEINKVQQMIDNTQNEAVQKACKKRITKLKDEWRFYQIVQEKHKIQAMMEGTEVAMVKTACKARFKQLIAELETLHFHLEDDDDGENDTAQDDGPVGPVCGVGCAEAHSPINDNNNKIAEEKEEDQWHKKMLQHTGKDCNVEEEDGRWYERALQYINATTTPVQKDEPPIDKEKSRQSQGDDLEERDYEPGRYRDRQQHTQEHREDQNRSTSQVRFSEDQYESPKRSDRCREEFSANHTERPLSPRSETSLNDAHSSRQYYSPRGQGRRELVARRPVANAVKSRTTWFG